MGSTFPSSPHYYNIIITMNYSVLAVVLLSLGSVLATPAFLKDVDMCEELECCPTTTTVTTTTTGATTTTTVSGDSSKEATEAPTPSNTTAAGPTETPTPTITGSTTTADAPTCADLNCNCGGGDDESSGANHVLSIAVLAAGFFLSFLL